MYVLITEEDFDINQLELREKAIYELMDSSRMFIDEIINLTYGDFINSIENYLIDGICPFDVYEIVDLLHLRDDLAGIWEMNDSKTFISSHESILAILDYLESERNQCIPFDEPLFQCDDGGKLSIYHILSIFEEGEGFFE